MSIIMIMIYQSNVVIINCAIFFRKHECMDSYKPDTLMFLLPKESHPENRDG